MFRSTSSEIRRRRILIASTAVIATLTFAGMAAAAGPAPEGVPTETIETLPPFPTTTWMPTSTTIEPTTSTMMPSSTTSPPTTSTTLPPTTSTSTSTTTTTTTMPPIPPDLSPAVEVTPDLVLLGLFGVSGDLALRLDNASAGESFGPVTVRIPKDSARIRSLTLTGGSGWTLNSAVDGSNYVLTYTPIIAAGASSSTATVRFSLRPGLLTTRYALAASIDSGSGGDATPNNDTAADTIYVLI